MTCVHKVRWSVKRPENCRFRLSVSHYKDRIVAPDEYSGATEVTPSHIEQVLQTKDKLVREDITVLPAPTEYLSTDHNGTFTPSDGKVGFSQVDVDVNPDLRPLSVSENGTYSPDGFDGYSDVTVDVEPNLESLSVTENGLYLPESGVDGYDRVSVDVPRPSGTKQLSVTQNGTVTEDVSSFANVQINTNVVNQDYEDALVALGVTEDLTDGIEALTTYANGVTGESDTTLSDAVASLADGYGGGGGGLEYEEGTYTAESDGNPTISFTKTHATAPIFVLFVDSTGTVQSTANGGIACVLGNINGIVDGGIEIQVNGKGGINTLDGLYGAAYMGTYTLGVGGPRSPISNILTSTGFKPFFGTTARTCKSGRTYKWIAIWR